MTQTPTETDKIVEKGFMEWKVGGLTFFEMKEHLKSLLNEYFNTRQNKLLHIKNMSKDNSREEAGSGESRKPIKENSITNCPKCMKKKNSKYPGLCWECENL